MVPGDGRPAHDGAAGIAIRGDSFGPLSEGRRLRRAGYRHHPGREAHSSPSPKFRGTVSEVSHEISF